MKIDGFCFVITGAGNGIGEGTALLAAEYGAKIVVSDTDDTNGKRVARMICELGGEAVYQHCDVSDENQVADLMAFAYAAYGGIDVLHNNAGIHESIISDQLSLEQMPTSVFNKVMAVNLTGAWLCAKYALPYLRASANASIINSASVSSISGYQNCVAYGASKGGVMQLTKMLAVDLAADNIRVNCYCPGSVRTQMVDNYLNAAEDPELMLNSMTKTHLIPRMGTPKDVAELVCFLASPQSQFVNGVAWLIDGGSLAWRGTADQLGMET